MALRLRCAMRRSQGSLLASIRKNLRSFVTIVGCVCRRKCLSFAHYWCFNSSSDRGVGIGFFSVDHIVFIDYFHWTRSEGKGVVGIFDVMKVCLHSATLLLWNDVCSYS